jgi:3-ketosteroid 9alpha-monooxygenase subunit A
MAQVEEYIAAPQDQRPNDLPFAGFARGWYQVAWTHELEPGDIKNVRYFGMDLIIYRGESGKIGMVEAYCGHLGAHLGHGGTVQDDCVVCPFHAWKWDADGHNVEIPYSARGCNKVVRMRSFPTMELNGLVLAWYHPDGEEPDWTPPGLSQFEDPDFYPLIPHGLMKIWSGVHFQPQHVIENSADAAHLMYVHKNASVPAVLRHEADGPFFRFNFGATYLTPEWGEVPGEIPGEWWGTGLLVFEMKGVHDSAEYVTVTPIDEHRSDMRLTVVARRVEDHDTPDDTMAMRVMRHQIKEVDRDLPIWDNMRYNTSPTYASEEVKYFQGLRNWSYQFYPRA